MTRLQQLGFRLRRTSSYVIIGMGLINEPSLLNKCSPGKWFFTPNLPCSPGKWWKSPLDFGARSKKTNAMGSCRCRRPPQCFHRTWHSRPWPAPLARRASARVGTMAEVRGEQVGRRLRVDDQLNRYWVPGHLNHPKSNHRFWMVLVTILRMMF